MKCIVKIKKSGRYLRPLLRHLYLTKGRQPREVASVGDGTTRVAGTVNGMPGALTMLPAVDAASLGSDIWNRSTYRHVILSLEDCADIPKRREAAGYLKSLGQEWAFRFAPDTPYIGVVHDDRSHMHIHLAFRNDDGAGRALSWSKDTLREMQSMTWVSSRTKLEFGVEPGRGAGVRPKEFSNCPYPLADLDAKKLAGASKEQLYEYERTGTLTIGRVDKQGDITSIIFNGRRIRLSTLRGLAGSGGFGGRPGEGGGDEGELSAPCHFTRLRASRRIKPS